MISADALHWPRRHSLTGAASVLLIASMATFMQSFIVVKLICLALFLAAAAAEGAFRETIRISPRLICFYLTIGIAGIIWAFVGMLNPGSYFEGISDSLRLYTIWSAAYALIYTILRSRSSPQHLHRALVVAGVLISMINFAGVLDEVRGSGVFSDSLRKELYQYISIYDDGYIQITSHNIGSLFFIVPYLIALQVRTDSFEAKSIWTRLSLVLCLILTVISGRRALFLTVALTPCLIIALSALTGDFRLIKVKARRVFLGYTIMLAIGFGVISLQPELLPDVPLVQHLEDAFSAEDERTIQKPYLIEGFYRSPIMGLGFGAAVDYQRSPERPWLYELTYYQMLLNAGLVGSAILSVLLLIYGAFVTSILRIFKRESAIPFSLIVGLICLLIGASSNPYLGSFDLLFFVGILPYLSTFRRGFSESGNGG